MAPGVRVRISDRIHKGLRVFGSVLSTFMSVFGCGLAVSVIKLSCMQQAF